MEMLQSTDIAKNGINIVQNEMIDIKKKPEKSTEDE